MKLKHTNKVGKKEDLNYQEEDDGEEDFLYINTVPVVKKNS